MCTPFVGFTVHGSIACNFIFTIFKVYYLTLNFLGKYVIFKKYVLLIPVITLFSSNDTAISADNFLEICLFHSLYATSY